MAVGSVKPREALSELARLGARLIIQRVVEDEFDAWLGRARYERRPDYQRGRGAQRLSPAQSADARGGAAGRDPAGQGGAEPFVSKLFPCSTKLLRTEPLRAMVIAAFVLGPRTPKRTATGPASGGWSRPVVGPDGERALRHAPRPPGVTARRIGRDHVLVSYLFGDWDDDCQPVSTRLTLDVNDDALPPTGQDVHLRGERGQRHRAAAG